MKTGIRTTCGRLAAIIVLAGAAAGSGGLARAGVDAATAVNAGAESAFLDAHPAAAFYKMDNRITTVYGRAFQRGNTAEASAQTFLERHASLFGVAPGDLVPGSLAGDDAHTRGLMFDSETGAYKFTLVSYLQTANGIPVFQSDVRLLVRNEEGNPLVLVRSALRPVNGLVVQEDVAAQPNMAGAFEHAMREFPGIGGFSAPRVVVFAGDADTAAPARLAVEFEGSVGAVGDDVYERWHIVADAATGEVLWRRNMICHTNVTGSVKAMATPGFKADICAAEVVTPLPYARATIGATTAYADASGNFTITNAGTTQVTVGSEMRGRWFRVYDSAAASANPSVLSLNVTPPGPANFVHNPSNNSATKLSGANAYISANKVRDYALTYDPAYPVIFNQSEFRININVSGTCNAYYDGSSINFYAAGGGCASTAYGDVVYHEYGHHMVSSAGSGQGQYGEGYGDLNGVVMDDDPVLGYGFTNNCNGGIRTAANTKQYPCSGEIHDCGQLLTGCFWSTRNLLVVSNPSNYRTLLGQWAVNSVQVHTGDTITPQITIDVMTLDDDDADITNGTPHYDQIQGGFSAHNMAGPTVNALSFAYPNGRPAELSPGGTTTMTVVVTPNQNNTLNTSSGKLYVDPESDGTYVAYPMTYQGNNTFLATFPAIPCDSAVRYYVEAKTGGGTTMRNPLNAPTGYYTAFTALNIAKTWSDDCETNPGWVAHRLLPNGQIASSGYQIGDWVRSIPNGGSIGEPSADNDAGPSGKCWTTGSNNADYPDVDPAYDMELLSPVLNGLIGNAVFSYARWFYSSDTQNFDDSLLVQVSNNGGVNWVTMETVTSGSGGWTEVAYRLGQYVPLTSQMMIRFLVSDGGADSTVEAALDSFSLGYVQCTCTADFNGDTFVSGDDFDDFVVAFEAGDPSADVNHDNFVSGDDFDTFVIAFESGC